jgi:hypothetical protein
MLLVLQKKQKTYAQPKYYGKVKGTVQTYTGTEALYRPYGPQGE